ncbi:SWIM zinc finger domain-containing protein [Streptomyces sp. Je 1-79]|uniref:SWIM zinc finger family protein n=1 Tax=Streptomyces sp. Je 1-79 TaxID=2943847 RepID=UPI0021A42CBD|nr:SWIM zinc finger family protein [Streptomyces sp. Je 1-79]MCT4355712.1 SWIM zinc finger domain-containing protein [Streptomyces sp. Je 1-79]
MNTQGVRWTADQVLALAPDDASRRAGSKLGTAGPWSGTGSGGDGAVWGLCRGSGSKPYRTVVDTTGPAYSCSCPSRKFPCKHALGLLLLWATDTAAVAGTEVPDWATGWLEGRRERAAVRALAAEGTGPATADPEAARRRAERRSARITSGAEELEQRLADLLRGGLASAERSGYGLWEETAARMVDAQAPGLAGRVRELGAIPGSGPGWPVRLLEECALTHLLDRAWLSVDRLPGPLAATVRTRVGLTAPAEGPSVRDHWLVLAQYDTGDGKLTTRRIWLHGRATGRTALLLSFGAVGRAPQLALPVGAVIDAALTPHAGAGLRAELGEQFTAPAPLDVPPPGGTVGDALTAYGLALREDPWLDSWPVTLSDVVPIPTDHGWQLADATPAADGGAALPLSGPALGRPGLWRLAALSGGGPVTVFGECGHRGFTPLAAWSAETPGETVPLH